MAATPKRTKKAATPATMMTIVIAEFATLLVDAAAEESEDDPDPIWKAKDADV